MAVTVALTMDLLALVAQKAKKIVSIVYYSSPTPSSTFFSIVEPECTECKIMALYIACDAIVPLKFTRI